MKRALLLSLAGILLGMLLSSTLCWGQGVLIFVDPPAPTPLPRPILWPPPGPIPPPRPIPRPAPEPPATYKIKELAVQARLVDQVARVQVSQTFVNTGSRQMEVSFVFPLPYDGAIDRLTFLVDGKEYEAKLLPAAEARSIYEGYVRRNQDPALLEWVGTGMFKTSVFPVPPGADRQVTLRYNQLLRKDRQVTDFLFPLSTAKYTSRPIESMRIRATIETKDPLKSVYSPTHEVQISRAGQRQATVEFEAKDHVPTTDFRLIYDTASTELSASVLSYRPDKDEDGFFLLLASPQFELQAVERTAKTVIMAVDRSGSMSGKKMEQAREALKFVLNNLRENDTFNIVAYDSTIETFRPELQRYDEATRQAALGFVEGLYAGGATNIDGALTTALKMVHDDTRPSYILFLTDGLPTVGETNEAKIIDNARRNNRYRARIISMGVGYDVNGRLLDRISRTNYGQSEYVRPNEDLERIVGRLYGRISEPVMTEVTINFDLEGLRPEQGPAVNRVYPREIYDLFAGEQLVIVGRYRQPGDAKVTISGQIGNESQTMVFPAAWVRHSHEESYAFVEKLWAMRRIGEIIEELDLQGKNEELIQELVALSTRHGILTPYTSFLADENERPGDLARAEHRNRRAAAAVDRLSEISGRSGFAQRAERQTFQQAIRAPMASGYGGMDMYGTPAAEGALGGAAAPARVPSSGGVTYRDIDTDREVEVQSVRIVGRETLYKRGNQWIAANAQDVDLERDQDKLQTIQRFSDEYFQLVAVNTPSENAVLARQQAGEELVIRLRNQIYWIR